MPRFRKWIIHLVACGAALAAAVALAGCGSPNNPATAAPPPAPTTATQTTPLPGTGKPPITIGDKNFTEQFILGELYYEALLAQGFSVQLNKNIGPTAVTMQALRSGQLDLYPEYLNVWNSTVAAYSQTFGTVRSAFAAAQSYAAGHRLTLLNPTPFSDTDAIATTVSYAAQNRLRTIGDLRKVEQTLTLGGPPQFQQEPTGLPAIERTYGLQPAAFKALEIPQQYEALDHDVIQAADVATTDGQLTTGNYTVLEDPLKVFGVGNVVPVVSSQILDTEGPAFEETINRVSALLTLPVIRELNAEVDLSGEDPAAVAKQFLTDHGVVPATS